MSFDGQLLKGTVVMLVLRLLRENDMYGYQIIREIEQRSQNVLELNEGALYPVLHKLEAKEFIESYWEEAGESRRRKYYHITPKGGELFEEKNQEWLLFSGSLNMVLRAV